MTQRGQRSIQLSYGRASNWGYSGNAASLLSNTTRTLVCRGAVYFCLLPDLKSFKACTASFCASRTATFAAEIIVLLSEFGMQHFDII